MLRVPTIVAVGFLTLTAAAFAQHESAPADRDAPAIAEKPAVSSAEEPAPSVSPMPAVPSNAERISRLQRTLAADKERLAELRRNLKEHQAEFDEAGEAFRALEEQIRKATARLLELKDDGDDDGAAKAEAELKDLTVKRDLARERFDLAIETVNGTNGRISALELKIENDTRALDQLLGKNGNGKPASEPSPGTPAPAVLPAATPAETSPGSSVPSSPLGPASGMPATIPGSTAPSTPAAEVPTKPETAEVAEARREAERREEAAQRAESDASQTKERLAALEESLRLEREALAATERRVENGQRELEILEQELAAKLADAETPPVEVRALQQRIREAQARVLKAASDRRDKFVELERMQSERAELLAEQLSLLREANAERRRADEAKARFETLKNPFTVRNLTQWFLEHGPRLLGIVAIATLLQVLVRYVGRRIVRLLIGSHGRGTRPERENRARTLVGVFENSSTLVIAVGALLMVLDEVGIPVIPLLGGAAVVGLAVAFGAQNLIRDYFYGFMILLENQYGVNDVVRICDETGMVERITLRMTVLRDLQGAVHFIPHGQISTVSNMTHGWSRAVFEIGVAYKEDPDRVMDILMELGREMVADRQFGPLILDNPEMLGVDAFADSAVVIKFFIKTRPLQQWVVKRELLRRIKRRFNEEGIEIPFPHRMVYHRTDDAAGPSVEMQGYTG